MADWSGTFNGLSFGIGTPYVVTSLDGWYDMTAAPLGGASTSTTPESPKPFTSGSWTAPDYTPARTVNMGLGVMAANGTDFADAVAALRAATQPQTDTLSLSITLDGVTTTADAKVRSRTVPTVFEYQFGLSEAVVEFFCPDPRRFGAALVGTTALPSSTGGLTFPATWPAQWAATQVTGAIDLTNPGDTSGPLVCKVVGPCTGPTITHVTSGTLLEFAADLTIPSGSWLTVDMEARTVLLNDQASRAGYVTSRGWFGFDPGDNNIAFNAASYDAGAQLQVTATPAWI